MFIMRRDVVGGRRWSVRLPLEKSEREDEPRPFFDCLKSIKFLARRLQVGAL